MAFRCSLRRYILCPCGAVLGKAPAPELEPERSQNFGEAGAGAKVFWSPELEPCKILKAPAPEPKP